MRDYVSRVIFGMKGMLGEMVPSSFNLYWRIVNKKSFNKGDFQEWEWGLGRTREGKSAWVTT